MCETFHFIFSGSIPSHFPLLFKIFCEKHLWSSIIQLLIFVKCIVFYRWIALYVPWIWGELSSGIFLMKLRSIMLRCLVPQRRKMMESFIGFIWKDWKKKNLSYVFLWWMVYFPWSVEFQEKPLKGKEFKFVHTFVRKVFVYYYKIVEINWWPEAQW